jgi:hypothetical protein
MIPVKILIRKADLQVKPWDHHAEYQSKEQIKPVEAKVLSGAK